jgi:serine/threonine protein phosphatase PrpC
MEPLMPNCPSCTASADEGDRFCGECGAALVPLPMAMTGCTCGGAPVALDRDGFCDDCGKKVSVDPHDHAELVLSKDFAGVTDRGRRHQNNEDALLIAEAQSPLGPVQLLVVCDGVSSSSAADEASQVATAGFRDAALKAVETGAPLRDAIAAGAAAAQAAVCAVPFAEGDPAPAATLMAALICGRDAVLAWAGDSRAYLLAPTPRLLTRDDSWLNEIVAMGTLSEEQAKRHPNAHAITSCLGQFEDGEIFQPHIEPLELPGAAILLLCSDGLWNYAETPDAMARLLPASALKLDTLSICRAMIAYANEQGGHDNITVAMLRVP